MLTAYVDRLPGKPIIPILFPNFGKEVSTTQLFQSGAFAHLTEPLLTITDDATRADVLLLPHNYPTVRREEAYIQKLEALSQKTGKRVIVFWHGDGTGPVPFSNALVFRTSQYRSSLRPNEIIMPAYAEDLMENEPFIPREMETLPIVGFCGWASFPSVKTHVLSILHAVAMTMLAIVTLRPKFRARIKGLILRRRALRILRKDLYLRTDFILRDSHSAHRSTIRIDPLVARDEYTCNLLHSDFVLCIKGDGNYSLRFYEALSIGRIPLFVDTDAVLPREDTIDYDSFIVRVPQENLSRIGDIVRKFWATLTQERFEKMQHAAREAFEKHLSTKAFLSWSIARMGTDGRTSIQSDFAPAGATPDELLGGRNAISEVDGLMNRSLLRHRESRACSGVHTHD